jgi:hypothetical protein
MALRILICFAFVLTLAACSGKSPSTPTAPTPTVTSVAVSIANAILFGGSAEQATATVTMSNGTTQQMAGTWTVDNTSIATVDTTGRVTGQGSGRANVAFNASGISGSTPFRVVPNYQGQWSGSYLITGCAHSGAFAAGNFCAEFSNNRVFPMNMTLTQGSRDVVEGRTFLGTLQTDLVTGPVETDGAVQFSGIIRSGNSTIDVFWRFNATQPGRMIGSLRQTWRQAGLSGQGEVAGEFRDMNKQSSLTAPAHHAMPMQIRSVQDMLRALAGQ